MDSLKVAERLSNNFIASVSKLPCSFGTTRIGECTEEGAQSCSFRRNADCPRTKIEAETKAPRPPQVADGELADLGLPPRVVRVFASELWPSEARAQAQAFGQGERSVLVLYGAIGSGKTVAAAEALVGQKAVFLTPTDLLHGGLAAPWRDPVRRSEIAVLDGVTRADVLADIHLFGATMQWLVRLVVEHERKLIITIDDDWNDRESGLPGGKPIRGIRNLIADATGQLILTYGSVYPVRALE